MIEREKINKENINSSTIPDWPSAKMEEDNLVKECHEKSIKYNFNPRDIITTSIKSTIIFLVVKFNKQRNYDSNICNCK